MAVEKKPVKIMETILRDAHQSLIATRMTTEQMLPIVDKMDKVGYHAVECWDGATLMLPYVSCTKIHGRDFVNSVTDSKHKTADAVPWTEHPGISSVCR